MDKAMCEKCQEIVTITNAEAVGIMMSGAVSKYCPVCQKRRILTGIK